MKNMIFDKHTRERYVRNIFCEMKSELESYQSSFSVTFERLYCENQGFFYNFSITPVDMTTTPEKIELYYDIHDYVYNIFNYLFNGHLSLSCCTDDKKMEMEFEITSDF